MEEFALILEYACRYSGENLCYFCRQYLRRCVAQNLLPNDAYSDILETLCHHGVTGDVLLMIIPKVAELEVAKIRALQGVPNELLISIYEMKMSNVKKREDTH